MSALPVIDPKAAAIDIGSEQMHVSIAGGEPKVFGSTTAQLHALRAYLLSQEVRSVSMEATGVYWLCPYEVFPPRRRQPLPPQTANSRYVSGELKATEGVTLDKAWDATLVAMTDLKYSVTEKQKTGLEGNLTARAPGDRKVQIHLEKKSDTVTAIGIRVGTFGDESLSRQILAKIKSHF